MTSPPDDLTAWRAAQRRRLIDQRMAIDKETLARWQHQVDRLLTRGFKELFGKQANDVLAICWPVRNEYDARPLARQLRQSGTRIALPVVVAPGQALLFRAWNGDAAELAHGPLGIDYPASGPAVVPTALLLPMVGFDRQGYRLGYGGGYFDRTLAAMQQHPLAIGVAHEFARLETLYAQPHDIAMDYVVTESGIYRRDGDALLEASAIQS